MAANDGKGINDGEDERHDHQSTLSPKCDNETDNEALRGYSLARERAMATARAMWLSRAKTSGQDTRGNNNNNSNSNDVDEKYKCRKCGLEFDSIRRLSGHMKHHWRPHSSLPPPEVMPNINLHNLLLKPDTDAATVAAAPPPYVLDWDLKEETQQLCMLNVSPRDDDE